MDLYFLYFLFKMYLKIRKNDSTASLQTCKPHISDETLVDMII